MPISTTIRLAVVAGATLAATLVPVTTAHADYDDCPLGRFCAWTGDGANGARAQWLGNDSDWGSGASYYIDNNAESVYNHGWPDVYDTVLAFTSENYRNFDLCIELGDYWDWWMDDNVLSSHHWASGCP